MIQNHQTPDLLIFGGSFDPPHLGHASCLISVHQMFPKTPMLVIPAAASPTGGSSSKSSSASFEDRLHMCRLAFEDLGLPLSISSIEKTLPIPSYTIQTLRALKAAEPSIKRFGLIVGMDQFQSFHLWKEAEEILAICELIVMNRDVPTVSSLEEPAALFPLKPLLAEKGRFLSHPEVHASSTASRKSLADLHPAVLDYIKNKNLYSS